MKEFKLDNEIFAGIGVVLAFVLKHLFGWQNAVPDHVLYYLCITVVFEAVTIGLKYLVGVSSSFSIKKFAGGLGMQIVGYVILISLSYIVSKASGMADEQSVALRNNVCLVLMAFNCINIFNNLASVGFKKEVGVIRGLLSAIKGVLGKVITENGGEKDEQDDKKN